MCVHTHTRTLQACRALPLSAAAASPVPPSSVTPLLREESQSRLCLPVLTLGISHPPVHVCVCVRVHKRIHVCTRVCMYECVHMCCVGMCV